jgi:TPR repeat protein
MYDKGEGVPQNMLEAALWWQKAADQGHVKANFNLGQLNEQQGEYQAAIVHYRAGQAVSPEEARNAIRRCVGAVVRAKQEAQEEKEEKEQEEQHTTEARLIPDPSSWVALLALSFASLWRLLRSWCCCHRSPKNRSN